MKKADEHKKSIYRHSVIIMSIYIIIVFSVSFLCHSYLTEKYDEVTKSTQIIQEQLLKITEVVDTSSLMRNKETLALITAKAKNHAETIDLRLEIQKQSLFWYNVSFLGIGTILGYLYLLFYLPKQIESRAALEVDLQIVKLVKERHSDLSELLSKYDTESQLINNSRIGIYPIENSEAIVNELQLIGFGRSNIILYPDIVNKQIDVLVINYEEMPSKELTICVEEINSVASKVINKSPKFSLFILKEKHDPALSEKLSQWRNVNGLNFANSYAQLFANLMNTLKYRKRRHYS
jgi:hypothetical protein